MKEQRIIIIAITLIFMSCKTTHTSISGYYLSNCGQLDNLNIKNDSTYIIKYTLGSVCNGKWKIINDTIFLMDNWKQENLRDDNFLFNDNDTIIFGKNIVNELNKAAILTNKPMRFIIKKNKFIGIDSLKYNYNKNCILKKVDQNYFLILLLKSSN